MSILQVNLGTYANDGTGDDLRTAFEKVNANFNELDLTRVITADNLGSGPGDTPLVDISASIFKEKVGNNLKFRSLVEGSNITLTQTLNEITISTPDSINALNEDPNPTLAADLNLNSFNIVGLGNIFISGDLSAESLEGPLSGDVTGNLTGNVLGNVTGNVLGNLTGNVLGNVTGNVTGDLTGDVTGNLYGNVVGNVTGNLGGNVVGNVTGDLTGNVTGDVVGDLTGNVTGDVLGTLYGTVVGTVSSIANHGLGELNDIDLISTAPENGQALVYNAVTSKWIPSNVATGTTPGGGLDFGTFGAPAGFTLDLGTF